MLTGTVNKTICFKTAFYFIIHFKISQYEKVNHASAYQLN